MTNQLVLLESRTARQDRLEDLDDNRALETINKAKALVMAMWQGTGIATTEQMAEYYEVSEETVKKVYQRNNEEFSSDGVKVRRGKELKDVGDSLSLSGTRRTSLMTWPPRAALRLGMLLRDSLVAQKVRTILLDVTEQQPINDNLLQSQLLQLTGLVTNLTLSVAAIVESEHKALPKSLKADLNHPDPKIKEITTRTKIRKLVNRYCYQTNQNYQNVYQHLYEQYKLRYNYDVYAECEKTGEKCRFTQMETDGKLDSFYQMVTVLVNQQSQKE